MAASVKAVDLADGVARELLLDPSLIMLPQEEWPVGLKSTKVQCDPQEWEEVVDLLEERHLVTFLNDDEVIYHEGKVLGSGVFGVSKGCPLPPKKERGRTTTAKFYGSLST